MRFTKFLAIVVLAIVSSTFVCHAQCDKYYKVDDDIYVVTDPGAKLYLLPELYYRTVFSGKAYNNGYRDIFDINEALYKTIRRSQSLRVMRYTNVVEMPGFDAYIVVYNSKLWVLRGSDVQDNTILDQQNVKMSNEIENLKSQYNSNVEKQRDLTNRRELLNKKLDSLVVIYEQICVDKINHYKNLEVYLPVICDSLVLAAEYMERARVDKEFNDWYKIQPASTKAAAKVISIDYAYLGCPDYVGGCDYHFKYINYSPKTIKYLHWTGTAYNAVDDPVYCSIWNTSTFSGKDTGPIAQGESRSGCWNSVIYNSSAKYVKLSKVQIIYMDGSSISIGAADIARLLKAPSREVRVNTSKIPECNMSSLDCRNEAVLWQKRLKKIQEREAIMNGRRWNELENSSYNKIVNSIKDFESQDKQLQTKIDNLKKDLETFEEFVYINISDAE